VVVTVAPIETGVEVTIADDGAGLPANFDVDASESLGLRIARTLAVSLGGRFSLAAAPVGRGTIARLEIELAQPEPPVLG
jgi:two-component sensor histidine kinase